MKHDKNINTTSRIFGLGLWMFYSGLDPETISSVFPDLLAFGFLEAWRWLVSSGLGWF